MCDEDIAKSCKQRFKGIENFLRRIAFNLGNTASQTEVKIISCIPIDVTDLQQKIINLEKELQNVKGASSNKNCSPPDVCMRDKIVDKTAAFNTSFPGPSMRNDIFCSESKTKVHKQPHCDICPLEHNKSNDSFVFSALSLEEPCGLYKKSIENTQCSRTEQSKRGNIFRRRKKKKDCAEINIPKTHLVYYAQTPNIPLCRTFPKRINKKVPKKKRDILGEHFSNVMRKQYDPGFGLEEFSDTSQFTRPICKDINTPVGYDSDICSCCHGRFQNIDNYMEKGPNLVIEASLSNKLQEYNTKTFYDSKFYDIVPVKEVNGKLKKDFSRTIETKKYIDMNCWPEKIRTKHGNTPVTVNYRAEIHPNSRRRHDNKYIQKDNNPQPLPSCFNQQRRFKSNQPIQVDDSSRSFSVNCGDIYPKQVHLSKDLEKCEQLIKNKRESHITVNINSTDNHVKTSKSIQLEVDLLNTTKTETMLNQIKSILQSVLTEVKTNTQSNKEETPKKDAVVQKGPSQNNMPGCSRHLNSFTYNSANNGSSYYAPYSQPYMPSGLCFASIPYQPVKCTQNTPYFIQPCQGHCRCSCQCKANSFCKSDKPATAATNTDGDNSTGLETSNLIKEIYKSVALNLDYPIKDNSSTDYETLKSADPKSKKSVTEDVRSIHESDVVKTDKEIEALLTCTETSSQSEEKDTKETTTRDIKTDRERIAANRHLYHLYRLEERNNRKNDAIKEQEETAYSSSEASDNTVLRVEDKKIKKEKKGFFNRIAKLLKRRKIAESPNDYRLEDDEGTESSEESETDDYETVYSGSANQSQDHSPTPQRQTYVKNKPRINIQVNGKRIRRSPYMEQEYRRHWNEDLTFQEKGQGYGPGRPGTSHSVRNQPHYTPYRRNYEARSVIVDNKENGYIKDQIGRQNCEVADEKVGFLKKHKLGLRCGQQWKNLILEN